MRSKSHNLSRFIAVVLLAGGLSVVGVNGAVAQTTPSAASCDPGMIEIMQDNANAARVRDNAVAYGSIQYQPPSAGMTCMDQAMGVTGRLGAIFSDKHDDAVPPANTIVFTPPLAYPDWGAGEFLVQNLATVITPMLGSHLGSDFGGTLGAALGMNIISSRFTDLIGGVTNIVGEIGGQINSFSGQINGILGAIDTIQTLAKALNLPMPSPVIIGAVAALEAAQTVAAQLMGALQSAMNMAVMPLIGQVMGEVMGPASEMECDNIGNLWNSTTPEGGTAFVGLQGGGPNQGVPFLPMSAFLQGTAMHGNSGFTDQLQSANNMEILDRALQNLTEGGLSRPGVLRSWQPAPSFGRMTATEDIIREMQLSQ